MENGADLHNSSHHTKVEFNNCFVIHSMYIYIYYSALKASGYTETLTYNKDKQPARPRRNRQRNNIDLARAKSEAPINKFVISIKQ